MTDTSDEEGELHSGLGLSTYHEMAKANAGSAHVTGVGAAPVLPTNAWNADPCGQEPPLGYDVNALPSMLYLNGVGPEAVVIPNPTQPERLTITRETIREAQAQIDAASALENPPDNNGMTYDPTLDPRRPEYIPPEPRPTQLKRRF